MGKLGSHFYHEVTALLKPLLAPLDGLIDLRLKIALVYGKKDIAEPFSVCVHPVTLVRNMLK